MITPKRDFSDLGLSSKNSRQLSLSGTACRVTEKPERRETPGRSCLKEKGRVSTLPFIGYYWFSFRINSIGRPDLDSGVLDRLDFRADDISEALVVLGLVLVAVNILYVLLGALLIAKSAHAVFIQEMEQIYQRLAPVQVCPKILNNETRLLCWSLL